MRKRAVIIGVLLLVMAGALSVAAVDAQDGGPQSRTVETKGGEFFKPNSKIEATFRFGPGHVTIRSGGTLTLTKGDDSDEPHTLSIVNENEVPATLEQVFGCGEPGTVCDDVFSLVGFPPAPFTNAPGTQPGIDGRLDTLAVLSPGDSASATVSAPPGTVLHFICAIHPWMQGEIDVK